MDVVVAGVLPGGDSLFFRLSELIPTEFFFWGGVSASISVVSIIEYFLR